MTEKLVIFGACSAIAIATAREYALNKAEFLLVARDEIKLKQVKEDLLSRGAQSVQYKLADLDIISGHQNLWDDICKDFPNPTTALLAYGVLGEQSKNETSWEETSKILTTNFNSPISLTIRIANTFEACGSGTIVVISSPAGDRGRKSNYTYGASKGGLSIYLEGLASRLESKGVTVITVKPGFVDTPMTASFKKGALWAQPEQIALGIKSLASKKASSVGYLPWFWRPIMFVIKLLPAAILRRLPI
jgi:decaprenylphospho-beta-D-erythro-pentofuranosid-2-ulose 2-reductase